jgi:hypothetical protein
MPLRTLLVSLSVAFSGAQASSVAEAAAQHHPDVTWQTGSVVSADFTCRGRQEAAILGTTSRDIVVAVFIGGLGQKPEVLRYSAALRDARAVRLTTEALDYDPKDDLGELPGFRRSKTCKGLSLSDDKIDSTHIYWNHDAKGFDDWVR